MNVLYADDWSVVPLINGALHGHLTLAMLWAQHNDNRMLVPNLVFLGLGVATRDDTTVLVWLSAAVFIAAFALFLILFRSYARLDSHRCADARIRVVQPDRLAECSLGLSVRLVFHPAVPPRHALLPAARMVRGGSRPGSRRLPVVVPGPRALGGRRDLAGMARVGQADSRLARDWCCHNRSLPLALERSTHGPRLAAPRHHHRVRAGGARRGRSPVGGARAA